VSTALVGKTFLILEALAEVGDPAPLRELTEKTGVPKSTVYRILQTLSELGYADQEHRTGNYYVTRRLAGLGRNQRYDGLLETATPLMHRLHARFDETVNLGVLEGSRIYYLHAIETTKPLRWIVAPGKSESYYCTALGKAIAAFLPEEQRRQLISSTRLTPRTQNTITSKRQLKSELRAVREAGMASEREENDRGVACFAIPLLEDGLPLGSISISVPTVRLDEDLAARIEDELAALAKSQSVRVRGAIEPGPTSGRSGRGGGREGPLGAGKEGE
jgi:DNA-binding IclR family transcriptional regulator